MSGKVYSPTRRNSPTKNNTEDQRLIYYGQLLNDSVTLKDVFTRYEAGEETHTVHLVCMPSKESLKMQARKMAEEKSKKVKEASASGASTSQRVPQRNTEEVVNEEREPSSQSPGRNYFQAGNPQPWMAGFQTPPSGGANNYMQQWAWMQQAYANYYMSQYMDMMARQNELSFRGGYDPRQTEAAHNPEPQAGQDVDEDDNRLNRDWLDYFHTMSRLLILVSFVYFYSSPARFFVVSSLGMLIYLYQVGFFRLNQNQAVENNNEGANNNIPAADNNNVIPPRDVPEAERQEEPGPVGAQNPEQEVAPPEHPSFMAITWTFVSSFFSSMIPDTHNAL